MNAATIYFLLFLWWVISYLAVSYLVNPSHVRWNNPIKQSRFVVNSAFLLSLVSIVVHSYLTITSYQRHNNIEFRSLSDFNACLHDPLAKPIFGLDYALMSFVLFVFFAVPLYNHLRLIRWIGKNPNYSILTFKVLPEMPPRKIFIFSIDNKYSCGGRYILSYYKYLVLPGKHKYQFWLGELHGKGSYRRLFGQEMDLDLLAGHQYIVEEDAMEDKFNFYETASVTDRYNESK
ncbi:hypothetical protein [Prevotella aurantiaca]|jgi:hypothetical protein|uniref:Uncharacterized protein n=1 Tax=Prevotella aurantiaca TaxID=596085 RepID=A0A930HK70_9BACT|nr:hypothetical protein [Prevotella aurantiaca]MBF1383299.1 hypothetical protein [Prevotella aurantiaca]